MVAAGKGPLWGMEFVPIGLRVKLKLHMFPSKLSWRARPEFASDATLQRVSQEIIDFFPFFHAYLRTLFRSSFVLNCGMRFFHQGNEGLRGVPVSTGQTRGIFDLLLNKH